VPPHSSTSISSRRAGRYLGVLAAAAALLLGTTAAFVYLRDPFQLLRPASGTANLYDVAEFQIPGVARQYPYDAVVAGTSISNNFRPADLAAAFGWDAMNLAIAGATIKEQRAVLDVALATGKVRHVFWGLDPFAFRDDAGRSFPYYLYRDPGWRTAPYFVNLGALMHGVTTMALPDAKRMSLAQWNDKRAWDRQYTYGRAQVLTAWTHRRVLGPMSLPQTSAQADQAVEDRVSSLVRLHPGVQFHLVLPPYSILYAKLLVDERPAEFEAGCRLDRAIVEAAGALPNARVYSFRDAEDITLNFEGFKDLQHFSGDVSRQIIRDVAAGRHRAAVEPFAQVCARIKAAAAAYQVPLR
jgi:hypothetical protein